jgi:hypothetical protein
MENKNEIGEEQIKMRSSKHMSKLDKYGHSTLKSRDYECFIVTVVTSVFCIEHNW